MCLADQVLEKINFSFWTKTGTNPEIRIVFGYATKKVSIVGFHIHSSKAATRRIGTSSSEDDLETHLEKLHQMVTKLKENEIFSGDDCDHCRR